MGIMEKLLQHISAPVIVRLSTDHYSDLSVKGVCESTVIKVHRRDSVDGINDELLVNFRHGYFLLVFVK